MPQLSCFNDPTRLELQIAIPFSVRSALPVV